MRKVAGRRAWLAIKPMCVAASMRPASSHNAYAGSGTTGNLSTLQAVGAWAQRIAPSTSATSAK
jgi:hypothetical protein